MVLDSSQACSLPWLGDRVDRGLLLGLVEVRRGREGGATPIPIRTPPACVP